MNNFSLNSILTLRKVHPCGSYDWKVIKLGADIKLECLQCGRVINIPRIELMKRIKKVTEVNDEK